MSNGAATLEASRTAGEAGRVSARGMGVGFSLGRMLAVTRKELQSYFAFPLVYILTGLFALLATGIAASGARAAILDRYVKTIVQGMEAR